VDWEKLLEEEGLGVIEPSASLYSYDDRRTDSGLNLGSVQLPDKACDDPVLLKAQRDIHDIAQLLPSRWAVTFILRARGLSQAAIGKRMGRSQSAVFYDLRSLQRVLPALMATRPVTDDEIRELIQLTTPLRGRRVGGAQKYEVLIREFISRWNSTHAAELAGLTQSGGSYCIRRYIKRRPDHPVSRLLSVINSVKYMSAGMSGLTWGGRRRAIAELIKDSDFSWAL
jgi:predicted transcriptional regulator